MADNTARAAVPEVPALDFERTAFPSLSILSAATGTYETTLSTDAQDVPGIDGSPTRLVKWGENAYAIRTSASQIVFISPFPDIFHNRVFGRFWAKREERKMNTLRPVVISDLNMNSGLVLRDKI